MALRTNSLKLLTLLSIIPLLFGCAISIFDLPSSLFRPAEFNDSCEINGHQAPRDQINPNDEDD